MSGSSPPPAPMCGFHVGRPNVAPVMRAAVINFSAERVARYCYAVARLEQNAARARVTRDYTTSLWNLVLPDISVDFGESDTDFEEVVETKAHEYAQGLWDLFKGEDPYRKFAEEWVRLDELKHASLTKVNETVLEANGEAALSRMQASQVGYMLATLKFGADIFFAVGPMVAPPLWVAWLIAGTAYSAAQTGISLANTEADASQFDRANNDVSVAVTAMSPVQTMAETAVGSALDQGTSVSEGASRALRTVLVSVDRWVRNHMGHESARLAPEFKQSLVQLAEKAGEATTGSEAQALAQAAVKTGESGLRYGAMATRGLLQATGVVFTGLQIAQGGVDFSKNLIAVYEASN